MGKVTQLFKPGPQSLLRREQINGFRSRELRNSSQAMAQ